jgi:hypothetical protein
LGLIGLLAGLLSVLAATGISIIAYSPFFMNDLLVRHP